MRTSRQTTATLVRGSVLAGWALLALAGCERAPELGTVQGVITLDGQPIDGGIVRFVPVDGATQPGDCPLVGGKYQVTIAPGQKRVEVFWAQSLGGKVADTASQGTEKIVQRVPTKYNTESTLTYDVVAGLQDKNFELTSK